MKFLHKYGTRRNEIRRAQKVLYLRLAMFAAVLLFFAIMVLITQFRPRLSDETSEALPQSANMGDPQNNPELVRMRQDVANLLEEFKEASSKSAVVSDDLDLLEKAIDLQRAIIRSSGSDIASKTDLDRLYNLETMFDEEMGSFLISESKQLEQEAEIKWIENAFSEGLTLMQKARDLQEKVNSQFPKSPDRNPSRLHVLNNKIMVWQTGPLAKKADQLKLEAFLELDAGNNETALEKIGEALEIQQTLSTQFRDSRHASISRMKEFESAFRKIQTAKDSKRIQALLDEARLDLSSGQPESALNKIEEAEQLHDQVKERYPEAAAQQMGISSALSILKDTCSSQSSFLRIKSLQTKTRQALLKQDMQAFQSLVADWYREVRMFKRSYPKSEFLEQISDEEVNFLYNLRAFVPSIMDMVYGNLIPIPGHPEIHLYRTEVPQVLYNKITGTNPSVAVLPTNPVESLTWQEAIDFTRKAGWILARPVSLPDLETFQAALGNMEPAELATSSWSSETSNRQIREVGTSNPNRLGFTDLLGNVSEWLADVDPSPSDVTAIGGAVRDSRSQLAAVPEESRKPFERNRFIGFRFAVSVQD